MLGHEHPDTLGNMNNPALVLDSQGKYEEAEHMHRQTLELMEQVPDHATLDIMNALALVLSHQVQYEQAGQTPGQAVGGYRKVLGKGYPPYI